MFKLVGPVLVKQDQNEAKQNVNTRLEFIQGEMYVFFLILLPIPIPIPVPIFICVVSGLPFLLHAINTKDPCCRFFFLSCSKRIEAQLKTLGEKNEAKKMEVCSSSFSRFHISQFPDAAGILSSTSTQLVDLQTALQQRQQETNPPAIASKA